MKEIFKFNLLLFQYGCEFWCLLNLDKQDKNHQLSIRNLKLNSLKFCFQLKIENTISVIYKIFSANIKVNILKNNNRKKKSLFFP